MAACLGIETKTDWAVWHGHPQTQKTVERKARGEYLTVQNLSFFIAIKFGFYPRNFLFQPLEYSAHTQYA